MWGVQTLCLTHEQLYSYLYMKQIHVIYQEKTDEFHQTYIQRR